MSEYTIKGLRFVQTCSFSPEQYDVYHRFHKVGYLRLRHGHFRCEDGGGNIIWESDPANCDGCFNSEEQRMKYLSESADLIKNCL